MQVRIGGKEVIASGIVMIEAGESVEIDSDPPVRIKFFKNEYGRFAAGIDRDGSLTTWEPLPTKAETIGWGVNDYVVSAYFEPIFANIARLTYTLYRRPAVEAPTTFDQGSTTFDEGKTTFS